MSSLGWLQVIIHAKDPGISRFNFTDHLRNQIEFGPIFNKTFLKEVGVRS